MVILGSTITCNSQSYQNLLSAMLTKVNTWVEWNAYFRKLRLVGSALLEGRSTAHLAVSEWTTPIAFFCSDARQLERPEKPLPCTRPRRPWYRQRMRPPSPQKASFERNGPRHCVRNPLLWVPVLIRGGNKEVYGVEEAAQGWHQTNSEQSVAAKHCEEYNHRIEFDGTIVLCVIWVMAYSADAERC